MPNELKSLSEIFNESIFRIPDYQRGYAWGTDQFVDFWEDLVNLPHGKNHYTGLLSIQRASDRSSCKEEEWLLNKGYKLYYVVDGQQRLTTFSIFVHEILSFIKSLHPGQDESEIYFCDSSLKEIREKYISKKRPPNFVITTFLFGYEKGNPSSDYLVHKVYDEPDGGTVSESFYTKNLSAAKHFFAGNIRRTYEKYGIQGIESLYIKLTQQLKFNIHDIDSDYDVYVAFETMNNRGKKLTNLELLKNRLIYLTTLFKADAVDDDAERAQVREDINKAWKEIYFQLGRNKDPLSDDEFLRAHWITYFHYSRKKGDDYIHFLLRRFSAKNVFSERGVVDNQPEDKPLTDYEEPEDVSDDQETDGEDSAHILTHIEIDNYVKSLQNFAEPWYYSWFPFDHGYEATDEEKKLIDRLNRIGIGYFRPLVVAAMSTASQTTSDERCALYKAIERFIFVSFRMGGYQASYLSSEFYNKSRQVLKGECTLSEVTARLNELTDNDHAALDSFIGRIKKMFDSGGGFYSWWGLRYFLYEYEAKLTGEKGLQRDGNLSSWRLFITSEREKVSIEHILPQTPTEWYWQNQFRNYSPNEVKILSGSLGNLLPLSQSINSSLQNDSFEKKKDPKGGKRRGYINGSHSEIEVAQNQDWSAQCIYDRGMKLLHFMEERWRIIIPTDQKERLLNIGFIHDGRDEEPELLITSAKDYASCIAAILTEKLGLPWVEERDSCVYCTTPTIDHIVSASEKNAWTGGRLISYEFECDDKTGIRLICKIASRAESVCDDVYKKCVTNAIFTNIKYEVNGQPRPTKRRRWVIVFEREVLTSEEMAKGLRECENSLNDRVQALFCNDIAELERRLY